MFLPVKQADCTEVLDRLMQTVKLILEASVQRLMPIPDFDELKGLAEPEFRCLLDRKAIRDAIEELFGLPYMERQEICEAFSSDMQFHQHIDDSTYRLHPLSEDGTAALDALCNRLYDAVGSGIPSGGAAGDAGGGCLFSVSLLQKQYERANGKEGRVCPVCVRELLFSMGEGEADHYFPRKKYPSLALHPYNILPICSDCNGVRFKHIKNPIDQADIGPGELRTVFLPYLRSVKSEVQFDVDENCSITMRPGPKSEEETPRRIENLERLYQLGKRWSVILSYVCDDIAAELESVYAAYEKPQERLEALREKLSTNAESTKDRRDFVKGIYCGWLLTKSDAELKEIFMQPKLTLPAASSE